MGFGCYATLGAQARERAVTCASSMADPKLAMGPVIRGLQSEFRRIERRHQQWSASNGCFDCNFTCDINGDGEITPQDALCAFQKYMGICPTACEDYAEIRCDVNQDGECTPADSLEIFKEYMGIRPNACAQQ